MEQAICDICDIFINRKRNTFNVFNHVNTFYEKLCKTTWLIYQKITN